MQMKIDQRLLAQDFIINSTKQNFAKYPYSPEMFLLVKNFSGEQQSLIQNLTSKEGFVEDYNLGKCSLIAICYFLEKTDFADRKPAQKVDLLKKYGFAISVEELQKYEDFIEQLIQTPAFTSFIHENVKPIVTRFNHNFESQKEIISKRLEEITKEPLEEKSNIYYTTSNGFNLRANHTKVIYSGDLTTGLIHEMLHQQFDERVENSISKLNAATNFSEKIACLEKQHPFIRLLAQELTNTAKESPTPIPYHECPYTKKDSAYYPIWYTYLYRNDANFFQKVMESFTRENLTSDFIGKNLSPAMVRKINHDTPYWELWTIANELEKKEPLKSEPKQNPSDFEIN